MALLCCLSLVACAAEQPAADASRATQSAPAKVTPPPPTAEELRQTAAISIVDAFSTREQVASVLMSNMPGTGAAALAGFTADNELGGFLLMGSNIPESPEALALLTAGLRGDDPRLPRLIAIDEEGGEVARIPWDNSLGANQLRSLPAEATQLAFADRAELLRSVGINVNFGIVADLGSDPAGFIYWRTLGDTADASAERVVAAVTGEHGAVASALKHFPGHGSASGDSHSSIPETQQDLLSWETLDGKPFAAGIDAGTELLMFGHLSYTAVDPLPASLSLEWHRIARENLGFTGVVISDDLGMLLNSGLPEYVDIAAIASHALAAGTDMVLIMQGVDPASLPLVIDGITATVDTSGPSSLRLREAAIRVTELRLLLGERASLATGAAAPAAG